MRSMLNEKEDGNRTAVVLILPLASFLVLFFFLDMSDFVRVASSLGPATLLAVVLVSAMRPIVGGIRSRIAFKPVASLTLLDATKGYVLSAYGSIFLPSAIGGDVLRIEHMKNSTGTTRKESFLVAATERVLGLLSLVFLTICVLFFDVPFTMSWYWLITAVIGGFALFLGSKFLLDSSDDGSMLNRTLTYVRSYASMKLLLPVFILSVLFQVISLSVPVLVAYSLAGLNVAIIIALVTPAIALFSALPISIGGIGLREASYVGTGALFNIDESVCLLSGLALSMSIILSGVPGVFIQSELLSHENYKETNSKNKI